MLAVSLPSPWDVHVPARPSERLVVEGYDAMIKLVLSDLDDTLIPFGAPRASARTLRDIRALQATGVHFAPVTGRVPAAMSWMLGDDETYYATGAFANGQVVRVDGRTVKQVDIGAELLQQVVDVLDGESLDVWLALYGLTDSARVSLVSPHPERILANPPDTWDGRTQRILPCVPPGRYVKANLQCSCSRQEMTAVRDLLRSRVPELGFVMPSLVARVIDINALGWGKADAVLLIARELGIDPSEACAFGDSENDLSMIRALPNSVAVANADESVQQAATWHIGPSKDDAVAQAFEDILAANAEGRRPSFMSKGFTHA